MPANVFTVFYVVCNIRRSLSSRNGGAKIPTESRLANEICILALRFLYPVSVPSTVEMSPILEAGVHKSQPLLADLPSSCLNPNVSPLMDNRYQSTFSALTQIQVFNSRLSPHPNYHPGSIDLYHSPIPALKPAQVFESEAHHVKAERRKEPWGHEDTTSDIFLSEYEPRKDPEVPSIQSPGPEVTPGKIPNEFPYAVDPTYDPPGPPEIPMPATPEPEVPELPCDTDAFDIEPEFDLPGAPELPSREF